MRFYCGFLICICTVASNGQTIFNSHIISGTQNEYLGSHTKDPLGNTYLNVFTNGDQALFIYGKSYNLNAGNYILRFDITDSLTMVYNAADLGAVQALAADNQGNMYVASAKGFQQNNFRYTKLDKSASIQWQIQSSVSVSVVSNQILLDNQGNSYVAGTATGSSFFGVQLVQSVCCPPKDFLLKISPSGILTWIRTSSISDKSSSLNVIRFDKLGNIILGGVFHTMIKMGTFSLSNPIGDNFSNMYMASVSPSGDILWLKGFPGEGYFWMQDFVIDEEGNYYFTGGFYGTTTFGNVTVATLSIGAYDFILGKLSRNFEVEWVKFKETYISAANFRSLGGHLLNRPNGVLVSGVAYRGFQIDNNKFLSASSNLQAFIAGISSDGSVSWLKGYGDALYPGSYGSEAPYYFKPGYQLSKVSDQCSFISGNFVNTLDTDDGLLQSQSRDVFVGTFSETPSPSTITLGPDVSISLCHDASYDLKLNSTLGENIFLVDQGTLPTIIFLNDSIAQLSNIAYGVTKFKWLVKNCATLSSKTITISRVAQTDGPPFSNPAKFCTSQLSGAVITLSGNNIVWYSDESLSHQIANGNSFVPSVTDTVYATKIENGCISKPTQVIISIVNDPPPPMTQPYLICPNHDFNLTATGQNLSWYSSPSSQSPIQVGDTFTVNYANAGTDDVFVTQTIDGCESPKAKVSIVINEIPPPSTSQFTVCAGVPVDLTATGENLSWYDGSTSAIANGTSYSKLFPTAGIFEIGVSQTVNGCESSKSIITINVTQFSLNDIFIPNVITPNGDLLNEEFYLMPFPNEDCIGKFKSITIINRWGNIVFYNTDRNFKWGGDNIFGTYYYVINFEKIDFKGIITVSK